MGEKRVKALARVINFDGRFKARARLIIRKKKNCHQWLANFFGNFLIRKVFLNVSFGKSFPQKCSRSKFWTVLGSDDFGEKKFYCFWSTWRVRLTSLKLSAYELLKCWAAELLRCSTAARLSCWAVKVMCWLAVELFDIQTSQRLSRSTLFTC